MSGEPKSGGRILWGQALAVPAVVIAVVWAAVEWTAWRLGWQPGLGRPWLVLLGWPIYPPWALFLWWIAYGAYAPRVFDTGGAIASSSALAALAVSLAISLHRGREPATPTTYGSARWGTVRELRAAGLLGDRGVIVGVAGRRLMRHDGEEHVLCVAPTRTGKGVGLVVPTLLTWPASVLVHDIKGENWALTAGFRARLGRVLRFDPTDPACDAFNPLLEVRLGEREVSDAQNIADMLVDPEGRLDQRSHWDKTSHSLLVGLILHVLYAEPDKTLAGLAAQLSDPEQAFDKTLPAMMKTPHVAGAPHPVVAQVARELLNKSRDERSAVVSTAGSFLSLYRDPLVGGATGRCDWRISDLTDGDGPTSLYLVVPPSDSSRTRPLIRLILNQIGRRLTENKTEAERRRRLLLLLDEFPALGRLDFFASVLPFIAGYRLKAMLIAQSLNQLDSAYGEKNAILENCHVRVYFAPNDERAAGRISDSLGASTQVRTQYNYAGGRLAPWLPRVSVTRQEVSRPLMTAAEVMQLPPDVEIVMAGGRPPMLAAKLRYYEVADLWRRILPPPPARSVGRGPAEAPRTDQPGTPQGGPPTPEASGPGPGPTRARRRRGGGGVPL